MGVFRYSQNKKKGLNIKKREKERMKERRPGTVSSASRGNGFSAAVFTEAAAPGRVHSQTGRLRSVRLVWDGRASDRGNDNSGRRKNKRGQNSGRLNVAIKCEYYTTIREPCECFSTGGLTYPK